jgi:K+-sensing histidine kinase KdpD
LFLAAVILTARFAGAIPGLAAAFLSVVAFNWYFDRTPHALDLTPGSVLRMLIFAALSLLVASIEHHRQIAISRLENANRDLLRAVEEIKTLRGILPICAHCKQIRSDKGIWVQLEKYIRDHSEADFTHSICPSCLLLHYPDFAKVDSPSQVS